MSALRHKLVDLPLKIPIQTCLTTDYRAAHGLTSHKTEAKEMIKRVFIYCPSLPTDELAAPHSRDP
jgi:hypothetical protein